MPLNHIAIIPDGNRRWAKEHGLPVFLGHREGARMFEKIAEAAWEFHVPYLTFWGCSIDNLQKRESSEVKFLLDLFEEYFNRLAEDKKIQERGVRIRVLGAIEQYFPPATKTAIAKAVSATAGNQNFHLTFMLAYNGTEEMLRAISNLQHSSTLVDERSLKDNLYTRELPPVDLVVRTGGAPHLSNGFMMWDTADAFLHFSDSLWPDFSPDELGAAVRRVENSERRRGR